MSLEKIVQTLLSASPPPGNPPFPDIPSVAAFLWKTATPNFWQEMYEGLEEVSRYVNPAMLTLAERGDFSGGWTGDFYTASPNELLLSEELLPPAEYRWYQANFVGLQWARTLLDRLVVRFDPLQCPVTDLPLLADLVNADAEILKFLSLSQQRRYLARAFHLQEWRGTDFMLEDLSFIMQTPVDATWHESVPFRKIITVLKMLSRAEKILLRRSFPPTLELEIHSMLEFVFWTTDSLCCDSTPGDYTAFTSSFAEVVEVI